MDKFKNFIGNIIFNIRSSTTKKMFLLTAVVFITFLSITFFSQKNLFEGMYYNKKETDIKNNVMQFSDTFTTAQEETEIIESIENYQNNYNTSIAVLNTSNNAVFQFKTNSEVTDSRNSAILDYVVRSIQSDSELLNRLLNSEQITIKFTNSLEGSRYLASAVMQDEYIIVGFTSLQQVTEAVSVIGLFYNYFYVGAIVLIIVLSLIYSRLITKPLRDINDVAVKVSNLEFGEKCVITSEDEIGNLGKTLNFLSDNLDASLTSLSEANKKLKSDIDKERKLEVIRREFVADVSHELKTPITLIKGYAEGIKDGIFLEGNIESSLDVIIEESDKMSKLVKDMLQLSALESGKEVFNKEVFSLEELIRKVVKKMSPNVIEKNVNINLKLIDNKIYGDIFKMEQVITNFLTNAIKYTNDNGDIFITMEEDWNLVKVYFENTGSYIDNEDLEKLWDKFYKVDKSRNRKAGGTGLGLSIVKNIIERHEGKYGVINTERGVAFFFELPTIKV